MKQIGEYTIKEVFTKAKKVIFYISVFVVVAFSAVVYAAWSDAQTAGSGKLTELNWNSLVTQLQTSISAIPTTPASPGGWACRSVSGVNQALTYCTAPEKLISGVCTYSAAGIVSQLPGIAWDYGAGKWGVQCNPSQSTAYNSVWLYCCQ